MPEDAARMSLDCNEVAPAEQKPATPKTKRVPSYLRMTKSSSAKKARKRIAESPLKRSSAKKSRPSSAGKRLTQPVGPKLASSMRPNAFGKLQRNRKSTKGASKPFTSSQSRKSGPVKAFAFEPDATVAQKVYKFQHKTPHRFHTKGKTSSKNLTFLPQK